MSNGTPPNVTRAKVDVVDEGTYPNARRTFVPMLCMHCESAPCVAVCPEEGATYKREEDGVVFQDYSKCIGCRMCIAACPYTGVRSFNWEEPRFAMDYPVGDADVPQHQKHVVEKCTLCAHRLARGEEPACINACPADARYFGDLNDSTSEVSKLIAQREYRRLLPEKGTEPSIYYLT
jgi:molybdopterin-containing oxidoreductase family iron-sulfur binding subunit